MQKIVKALGYREAMRVTLEAMQNLKVAIYYAECDGGSDAHVAAVRSMDRALEQLRRKAIVLAQTAAEKEALLPGGAGLETGDYE